MKINKIQKKIHKEKFINYLQNNSDDFLASYFMVYSKDVLLECLKDGNEKYLFRFFQNSPNFFQIKQNEFEKLANVVIDGPYANYRKLAGWAMHQKPLVIINSNTSIDWNQVIEHIKRYRYNHQERSDKIAKIIKKAAQLTDTNIDYLISLNCPQTFNILIDKKALNDQNFFKGWLAFDRSLAYKEGYHGALAEVNLKHYQILAAKLMEEKKIEYMQSFQSHQLKKIIFHTIENPHILISKMPLFFYSLKARNLDFFQENFDYLMSKPIHLEDMTQYKKLFIDNLQLLSLPKEQLNSFIELFTLKTDIGNKKFAPSKDVIEHQPRKNKLL